MCASLVISWPEQSGGDHSDSIWTTVGFRTRGDDDGVEHLIPELALKPAQVLNIAFGGNLSKFDFDCEYPAVSLDDEVDLVVTSAGPQVTHTCLSHLCVDPH